MMKKSGFLVMVLLVTVLVLSFSQAAFAESAANEGQLRLQEFVQANEQKQLRLQECGGVCDAACEPKQERLQKNEQLNAQKAMNRQQRLVLSQKVSEM